MIGTKLAPAEAYIEQLRRLDDRELEEEVCYLAAAVEDAPERSSEALTPHERELLANVEHALRVHRGCGQ